MSVKEDILIGVRRWLLAATGLTGSRIRPSNDPGVRPELPYLTIDVSLHDVPDGVPEVIRSLDGSGNITEQVQAPYTGTVEIAAFGPGASDLLGQADNFLYTSTAQALLRTAGLSVHATGGIVSLSQRVDDLIEDRKQRDYYVAYKTEFDTPHTDPDTIASMDQFESDFEFDDHEFEVDEP